VKTLRPGLVTSNVARTHAWTCRLRRGRYTWKVYATDQAGNTQGRPGVKTLTVR
jgi:hypothetical protein